MILENMENTDDIPLTSSEKISIFAFTSGIRCNWKTRQEELICR
jgi:hypothetical protein